MLFFGCLFAPIFSLILSAEKIIINHKDQKYTIESGLEENIGQLKEKIAKAIGRDPEAFELKVTSGKPLV